MFGSLLQAVGMSSGNHKIIRLILLQLQSDRFDLFWYPTPVALYGLIAQVQVILLPGCNTAAACHAFSG